MYVQLIPLNIEEENQMTVLLVRMWGSVNGTATVEMSMEVFQTPKTRAPGSGHIHKDTHLQSVLQDSQ